MSADDPTKPDLSLVDTDWMIEELARRHDAMLVVREIDRDDHQTETLIYHIGTLSARIGLAARATQQLLRLADRADGPE